jgi:hypothetical protein
MEKLSFYLLTKSIGLYLNILSFVFPKKASQLTYAFFSEPRKGKLDIHHLPEILKETLTETFQYDENSFQTYTWKGNDKIILLVHG